MHITNTIHIKAFYKKFICCNNMIAKYYISNNIIKAYISSSDSNHYRENDNSKKKNSFSISFCNKSFYIPLSPLFLHFTSY